MVQDEIVYLYVRCRFCKELLWDGQKEDGCVDDMAYGICSDCWDEINKLFVIQKTNQDEIDKAMERTKQMGLDSNRTPRGECRNCSFENTCEPFYKNFHKIPCARKANP